MLGEEFLRWLQRLLASRTPAAVVRFGDGEVRLLEVDQHNPGSLTTAAKLLERQTGRIFSIDSMLEIKEALTWARDEADVLGVLGDSNSELHTAQWAGRLAAVYSARKASSNRPVVLAHCRLNYQILAHLPKLLAKRRVSVISCRDVKPVIEDKWELSDVKIYRVPSQHITRELDGAYEALLHDALIWPDVHNRVRAELTIREPGEIFLIGAGVFGKDLCIHIRDRGGVALDLGSALDIIAGKPTHSPVIQSALNCHTQGMSISDIASYLHEHHGVKVPLSDLEDFLLAASQYVPLTP